MSKEDFTQKEMLIRIMDKVDAIETKMDKKLDDLHNKVNSTHDLASLTNGKVKLHTKLIFGLSGALVTFGIAIIGWILIK